MILKLITAKNKSSLLGNFHIFMSQQITRHKVGGKSCLLIYFKLYFEVWFWWSSGRLPSKTFGGKKNMIFSFLQWKLIFHGMVYVNYGNFYIFFYSPIMKIYLTFVCKNGFSLKNEVKLFFFLLKFDTVFLYGKTPFGLMKIIY